MGALAVCVVLPGCKSDEPGVPTPGGSTPSASVSVSVTAARSEPPVVGGGGELAGFGLPVPAGWTAHRRAVVGTEVQRAASACVAVEAVDSPVPGESAGPSLDHAAVQICAVPRADGLSLPQWLAERGATGWRAATFGSCRVLEVPGDATRRLAYVQIGDRRAEIAIVVATSPEKTEQRQAEVADLLMELQCPSN